MARPEFKPPLDPETMERLRRGIGTLDEMDYYEQTEQYYIDTQEFLESEGKHPPSSKRDEVNFDDDVPF